MNTKISTQENLLQTLHTLESENERMHDVLDKIRTEIEGWQGDIHDNEYDADKYDFVFERIFEILDKYRAESEE